MDSYGPGFMQELMFCGHARVCVLGVYLLRHVFAILLSGKRLMSRMKSGSGPSGALVIVQERYARGELSRQEFEQMKGVLEK